jgi:hypothetical protein
LESDSKKPPMKWGFAAKFVMPGLVRPWDGYARP